MRLILKPSFFGLIGLLVVSLAPVRAGGGGVNVLVVTGTDGPAISAGNVLNTDLTGDGFTVTVVNTGVPGSLAGYKQIFDTRYDNHPAFTAGEMTQYLDFLNAATGNAIFLMGENSGFNARNGPVNAFIALAGGGTIAVPAATSLNLETVNPPFTGPISITTVKYAACGLVTSSGTGAFASSETGGGCSIFFGTGALANAPGSALVVVYDVNFIYSAPTGGAVNEVSFRKNLEQFVSAPTVAPQQQPQTAPPAFATPTLTAWGQTLLALALCGIAVTIVRRRASV
jgi:hypothetical protein